MAKWLHVSQMGVKLFSIFIGCFYFGHGVFKKFAKIFHNPYWSTQGFSMRSLHVCTLNSLRLAEGSDLILREEYSY
jgi:hypothetical protein